MQDTLTEAYKDGLLAKSKYEKAMQDIERDKEPAERELVLLKRQKKIVGEDLAEEASSYPGLGDAYASLIMSKVMSASAKQKKSNHDQAKFRRYCLEHCQALRKFGPTNVEQAYCYLTGWLPPKLIKAAHLVPKSLQSERASYLFGVGHVELSDPRNCKSLIKSYSKMAEFSRHNHSTIFEQCC